MPILLIAYDLAPASTVAPLLAEAIMAFGTQWARPLAALWYVETDRSTGDVEAALSGLLDDDDGLLVQQVTGAAALTNTMLRWTPGRALVKPALGQVIAWPRAAHLSLEAA